jgi:hypothetical protein
LIIVEMRRGSIAHDVQRRDLPLVIQIAGCSPMARTCTRWQIVNSQDEMSGVRGETMLVNGRITPRADPADWRGCACSTVPTHASTTSPSDDRVPARREWRRAVRCADPTNRAARTRRRAELLVDSGADSQGGGPARELLGRVFATLFTGSWVRTWPMRLIFHVRIMTFEAGAVPTHVRRRSCSIDRT